MNQIAALYVESDGAYFGLEGVDPWDEARDARKYAGPWPVVAHPPCQRWGRYWHGAPCKPHQYRMGADNGCFASALTAVRNFGGVIEHPKDSHAWRYFGITTPPSAGGWVRADAFGGWTCCVWQGHYGHFAGKATWLYAVTHDPDGLPQLIWGASDSGPTPEMIERYGYAKARRVGRMALVGGKDKTRIRNATPRPIPRAALEHRSHCKPRHFFWSPTWLKTTLPLPSCPARSAAERRIFKVVHEACGISLAARTQNVAGSGQADGITAQTRLRSVGTPALPRQWNHRRPQQWL